MNLGVRTPPQKIGEGMPAPTCVNTETGRHALTGIFGEPVPALIHLTPHGTDDVITGGRASPDLLDSLASTITITRGKRLT